MKLMYISILALSDFTEVGWPGSLASGVSFPPPRYTSARLDYLFSDIKIQWKVEPNVACRIPVKLWFALLCGL